MPTHNQIIVFTKAPPGSYCSEGVAYRVERPKDKGAFRFVSVECGSSTFDQPWAVKMSTWSEAA